MSAVDDDAFQAAVAVVTSGKAPLDNIIKLQFYAYFKVATVAVTPLAAGQARPGLFDPRGRAKHDAWLQYGSELQDGQSLDPADICAMAKMRYVGLARDHLSFDTSRVAPHKQLLPDTKAEMTADELLDAEDSEEEQRGAGSGMVVSSKMATHEDIGTSTCEATGTIHWVASCGDLAKLRGMQIDSTNVNSPDTYGFTPLHRAADAGHSSIISYLLEKGADPDIVDSEGTTALETATIVGHAEVIRILQQRAA